MFLFWFINIMSLKGDQKWLLVCKRKSSMLILRKSFWRLLPCAVSFGKVEDDRSSRTRCLVGDDDYISLGGQFMRLCVLNNLSEVCHLLQSWGHGQGVVRLKFWVFDFSESLMIYTDKAFSVEDSDQSKTNKQKKPPYFSRGFWKAGNWLL